VSDVARLSRLLRALEAEAGREVRVTAAALEAAGFAVRGEGSPLEEHPRMMGRRMFVWIEEREARRKRLAAKRARARRQRAREDASKRALGL
jgi:hypothetical protein